MPDDRGVGVAVLVRYPLAVKPSHIYINTCVCSRVKEPGLDALLGNIGVPGTRISRMHCERMEIRTVFSCDSCGLNSTNSSRAVCSAYSEVQTYFLRVYGESKRDKRCESGKSQVIDYMQAGI